MAEETADAIAPGVSVRRTLWRRMLGPLALLILLVLGVLSLWALDRAHLLSRENIERVSEWIRAQGLWGPAIYIAICIVAVALLSPATPLIVIGTVFGTGYCILYSSVGLALGSGAAFLLARYTLRPTVERMISGKPAFRKIDEGVRRDGWKMVMVTRLVPIFPFNIQNYAYGLTGISFLSYLAVSWVCMLPAITAYAFAGGALVSGQGDVRRTLAYVGVGIILLLVLGCLPAILRRAASRRRA